MTNDAREGENGVQDGDCPEGGDLDGPLILLKLVTTGDETEE